MYPPCTRHLQKRKKVNQTVAETQGNEYEIERERLRLEAEIRRALDNWEREARLLEYEVQRAARELRDWQSRAEAAFWDIKMKCEELERKARDFDRLVHSIPSLPPCPHW